jgi:hypothetical protein
MAHWWSREEEKTVGSLLVNRKNFFHPQSRSVIEVWFSFFSFGASHYDLMIKLYRWQLSVYHTA